MATLTYDFDKFNKTGLKKVTAYFEKQGLTVTDVTGDNKPKRENGFQIKTAEITFESGQKLVMKVKADGNVYQWRLNAKVLAIKNYHTLDTAIVEVVAFVKENEANYQKAKLKALEKQKVAVPTVKPVNTTVAEQTQAFQANLDALKGQTESTQGELAAILPNVAEKETALSNLQKEIDIQNALTTELETKLENAKKGVFEAAKEFDPTPYKKASYALATAFAKWTKSQDDKDYDAYESLVKKYGAPVDVTNKIEKVVLLSKGNFKPVDTYVFSGWVLESADPTEAQIHEEAGKSQECPECNSPMTETETGYNCPECGCQTDLDGVILEGCKKEPVTGSGDAVEAIADKEDRQDDSQDDEDGIMEAAEKRWKTMAKDKDGKWFVMSTMSASNGRDAIERAIGKQVISAGEENGEKLFKTRGGKQADRVFKAILESADGITESAICPGRPAHRSEIKEVA